MKANIIKAGFFHGLLPLVATALAFACVARCDARPGLIAAPPMIVVTPPAVVVSSPPLVTVTAVAVPDYYAWDGYEYVGVVGGTYCYLGPGNVWLQLDAVRLARFHTWQNHHADWQAHATRNVKYRNDSHGHYQPLHDQQNNPGH